MFTIEHLEELDEDALREGSWIVLVHALRRPPHIAVISGGKKFELTVRGRETNDPLNFLLRRIQINRIPSVFIPLQFSDGVYHELLRLQLREKVDQCRKVEAGGDTCYTPVRAAFAEIFGNDLMQAAFIYEFIPALDKKGLLGKASQVFLETNQYTLPEYSAEFLEEAIRKASGEYVAGLQ